MKKTLNMTDKARNNYIGMLTHWIMVIIIIIFTFNQVKLSNYSLGKFLIASFLGLFSVISEVYFWKKDNETPMIKHFLGYGFAVFYTFVLFTSNITLTFLFVVPLLLVISLYNDTAYTLKINTGTIIESLILSILGAKTGKFGYNGLTNAIIQNLTMILIGVFSYLTAKTINTNLEQKLEKILSLANSTEEGIHSIYIDLEELNNTSKATRKAMEEVRSGTKNTTDAVEDQLLQTKAIGEKVDIVSQTTKKMSHSLHQTMYCVEEGNLDIGAMVKEVDAAVIISQEAIERLGELSERMKHMDKITKMIDDIAFQTNLLALNANVEAAHAGEAGRGFAVVATEVSEMSLKTKNATEDISSLIDDVTTSLSEVENVIKRMSEGINSQKECSQKTFDTFNNIQTNTSLIREQVHELTANVEVLSDANQGIMNSIETISSSSNQVSALADEAKLSETKNAEVLETISYKMQELVETTHS